MAGKGRDAIEVNNVNRDELRGCVQGHALALVDKVVDDVGFVAIADIGGGTAGIFVTNVGEGDFTEDAVCLVSTVTSDKSARAFPWTQLRNSSL